MPNNNGQQNNNVQDVQLEKYDESRLESREASRRQLTSVHRAIWKEDRVKEIESQYSEEKLQEKIEERKTVIENEYSEKRTNHAGYLRQKWLNGDKQTALKDIQGKIEEKVNESEKQCKIKIDSLEVEYNEKVQPEQEKLNNLYQQKQENDAEISEEKQAERAKKKEYFNEERKGWQDRLNNQYKLYNKPGTSKAEKDTYDVVMIAAQEKLKQLNDEEYELNQMEEELQKKKIKIDKEIEAQQKKILNLEIAKKNAQEKAKSEITNLYKDIIETYQKKMKKMRDEWLWNEDVHDEYCSVLNAEEKKEQEKVPKEVKAEFDKEKAAKIAKLESDVKKLEDRHNKGLDFYKELDKLQSTKKKVGSDTDDFKRMINSLKECADEMLENTVGKEAEQKLLTLGAEAYRMCQHYRSEKRGVLGGFRWSGTGKKRRAAAKKFCNKLLEICPGLREELGLEEENVNNKKGTKSEKKAETREPVKFPELDKKETKKNGNTKKTEEKIMDKGGKAK